MSAEDCFRSSHFYSDHSVNAGIIYILNLTRGFFHFEIIRSQDAIVIEVHEWSSHIPADDQGDDVE